MIGLFTSVNNGGIAQLTIQMLRVLDTLNEEVYALIPDNCETTIPDELKDKIIRYTKWKSVNPYISHINTVLKTIREYKFQVIWFMDNGIVSNQLSYRLRNTVKFFLTIHDATKHPSISNNLFMKIHDKYQDLMTNISMRYAEKIILLSPNSLEVFKGSHGNNGKYKLMNLGAHIPECSSVRPKEINEDSKCFYLFFGRIDKYKGLDTLLNAYQQYNPHTYPLVVAGSGKLSDEENSAMERLNDAIVINRFIKDEEMLWLFSHARALILPYIEASQSGIIPISYVYGIPVIVSNVIGLVQFVIDKETGFVCKNIDEYVNAMKNLENDELWEEMHNNCISYYKRNMDWVENVRSIIEKYIIK